MKLPEPLEHPVPRLAALVLAAGLGTRMRPFTDTVPKPLLTVGNEELLEHALGNAGRFTSKIAVNTHYLAGQVEAFVAGRGVHVSHEPELLGTAGAVGAIRDWLDGDDVLILNSDTWLASVPDDFVDSWDRRRPRLLVKDVGHPSDFSTLRFIGASLLPGGMARGLAATPSGLYERVWLPGRDSLDLVVTDVAAFDCGTPEEFLRANLAVSDGAPVIHPTARPGGPAYRSVFLRDATSPAGHSSVGEIRDGAGHVYVSPTAEEHR